MCQSKQTNTRQPLPYRDSRLTRILADSLTAQTLVVCTVSPLAADAEESIATLEFVNQARNGIQTPLPVTVTKRLEQVEEEAIETHSEPQKEVKDLQKQSKANEKQLDLMQREIHHLKAKVRA